MKRLALVALPFLLSACITDVYGTQPEVKIDPEKRDAKMANIVVTESPEAGSITKLTVSDVFKIELDANPTTGIWWQDAKFDTSVLKLVSDNYLADPAPEGIVGSGGRTIFTFEAIAPGTTRITSEYSRGGGTVYERLDIKVDVSE